MANYPAEIALAGDAAQVQQALLDRLPAGSPTAAGKAVTPGAAAPPTHACCGEAMSRRHIRAEQ